METGVLETRPKPIRYIISLHEKNTDVLTSDVNFLNSTESLVYCLSFKNFSST
jgi:hypothetical protein